MADEFGRITRKDRFEKKRTNTKAITWLSIVGGILVVLIIALIVFGGNDQNTPVATDGQEKNNDTEENEDENTDGNGLNENPEKQSEDSSETTSEDESDQEEPQVDEETEEDENEQNDEDMQLNEVESEDENVINAYEGNWEPIGTQQEGTHTTTFEEESIDWQEMMKAVEVATEVPVEEQVTWWFGRAGDQRAEATVSPKSNQNETYRVTMKWVEEQGWQPLLVEELIENKYNDNSSDNEENDEEAASSEQEE
ncbi:Protein of unknown function [Gracilibacillus orientalis]|uniref:DUF1510 domain-containing protein n=1 Tax=Gracilibacillus orientalis TaxID=334253 RepID=A0A1I4KM96_9BACI|nr:YrrS family protein [Gracilibacillus orientalis]SFL79683.1 Protein of unknown function [Gracilibacillus orientalis]